MPALGAVKKKAQAAVCKAHLHQWGLCYQLYANDFEGNMPTYKVPSHNYMASLAAYYEDADKLRTCPSAKKVSTANVTGVPNQEESYFGSTFTAWQVDTRVGHRPTWLINDDWANGSYQENSWMRKRGYPDKDWVKLANMSPASMVPLLLDGRWSDSFPRDTDLVTGSATTTEISFYNLGNWSTIRAFVMRRHKDGINGVMADMSATYIKTEDLWTYKWHKQFKSPGNIDLNWLKSDL